MTRVVLGIADQGLAREVQSILVELYDADVVAVATTTADLTAVVLASDPDIAIVAEDLGPDPVLPAMRDLSLRRPTTAMLLLTPAPTPDLMAAAMDIGARGVLSYPLSYDEVRSRLTVAIDWSSQMRRLLAAPGANTGSAFEGGRAKVVGFAGAKGGVGVTTLVTHMALDVSRSVDNLDICLVDLDLEKGDVTGILDVRQRVGIADVAKVAADLSSGTLADAMTRHESGVDLLLPPLDIREIESVTPQALRQVFAVLRQEYDLVLVDLGSHVTPAQATVVELVDELVAVVTPDVVALRGLRRAVNAWESLGVRKENDVRVLVNRASRTSSVTMETIRQLTRATVLSIGVPAAFRRLEPSLNVRSPLTLRDPVWWSTLQSLGREIGLMERPAAAVPTRGAALRKRRSRGDGGQVALETIAILPFVGVLGAIIWHLALVGTGMVLQSNAAAAAARAATISVHATYATPQLAAQAAAQDAVPGQFRASVVVSVSYVSPWERDVRVGIDVPGIANGVPGLPDRIETVQRVAVEP